MVAPIGGGLIGVGSAVARIDLLTFKVHGKAVGYSLSEARQAGYQDGIQRGAEGCGSDKWRCCDQEVCNTFSRVSERWTCKP